jgi:arylsulfatase A-like enzyme
MLRASKAPVTAILTAAVFAGAAVGVLDGVRAAQLIGADLRGFLNTMLLVAGQDAVVGFGLGLVAALLSHLGRWGRAAETPRWAAALGWLVAGLLIAAIAAGSTHWMAMRHNRFLAGGVVALAVGLAGIGGVIVAPSMARAVSPRFGNPCRAQGDRSSGGVQLAAPLVVVILAGGAFLLVSSVHAPVRGARLGQLTLQVAIIAAVVPFAAGITARLLPPVPRKVALFAALVIFVLPAIALAALRWRQDFQYLRWNDLFALASIVVASLLLLQLDWPRRPRWWLGALALPASGLVLFVGAGASEPARKAAVAHAGLGAPVIGAARVALDFDGDGYTYLLGGGDCNDRAPDINPGAQEWPDDGIDQNCDGKDASTGSVRALPLHAVPDSIPRDLNLLFVTIDTLRADHLGTYGYRRPTSPNIDGLGSGGIVFENGWAHAPSTRYSMPALATGCWPSTISWEDCLGCDRAWPRMGTGQTTLGEAMKGLGYFTGASYAFSYFRRDYHRGFERGIDDFQDQRADLHRDTNGPMESAGTSARQIADDAIAFFQRHRSGKWFLWLHFYDPHLGYEHHPAAPDFGSAPVDGYDAEIWFTDHHLGRALDALKKQGQWERTAVFVTGDHGEGLGEHGINAHGYHLYPPQTKVPFVWHVPGLAPRRVRTPVSHVDVAPTMVNLARGTPIRSFLGRSMLDLIAGAPSASVPVPPVFQEVTFEGPSSPIDGTRRRALVTAERHLLWNWMPDNTTECYDLTKDPGESRDLWGTSAGQGCVPMKAQLQDLVQVFSFPLDFAEKMAKSVSAPRAAAVPPPSHRVEAMIGSAVKFLGCDLSPPVVNKGSDIEVVYHFQVEERVPPGWHPFFHLDGPGGVRNLDHVPVGGVYPVERWLPGQRIRDRQRILIPQSIQPGEFTLYVGFWRGSERMPITPASAADGANRLRVGSFTVQ